MFPLRGNELTRGTMGVGVGRDGSKTHVHIGVVLKLLLVTITSLLIHLTFLSSYTLTMSLKNSFVCQL